MQAAALSSNCFHPGCFLFPSLVSSLPIALESFPISLCRCCLRNCNIVIYNKIIFGHSEDQNTFLIWICSLSTVLAHSSPNPCNFMSNKSNGDIFCHEFGLLSSVPEITSELWRWNECLVIHNKTLCTITGFMLMRWLLESTWRWGLVVRGTNHERELESPLISGDERGAGDWTNYQWPRNEPIIPM